MFAVKTATGLNIYNAILIYTLRTFKNYGSQRYTSNAS
jgi:hypothetical protein